MNNEVDITSFPFFKNKTVVTNKKSFWNTIVEPEVKYESVL